MEFVLTYSLNFDSQLILPFLLQTPQFFGRYDKGAYLFLPSYVMRTHGAKQQCEAVKRAPYNQLEPIFEVGAFHWCMCMFRL